MVLMAAGTWRMWHWSLRMIFLWLLGSKCCPSSNQIWEWKIPSCRSHPHPNFHLITVTRILWPWPLEKPPDHASCDLWSFIGLRLCKPWHHPFGQVGRSTCQCWSLICMCHFSCHHVVAAICQFGSAPCQVFSNWRNRPSFDFATSLVPGSSWQAVWICDKDFMFVIQGPPHRTSLLQHSGTFIQGQFPHTASRLTSVCKTRHVCMRLAVQTWPSLQPRRAVETIPNPHSTSVFLCRIYLKKWFVGGQEWPTCNVACDEAWLGQLWFYQTACLGTRWFCALEKCSLWSPWHWASANCIWWNDAMMQANKFGVTKRFWDIHWKKNFDFGETEKQTSNVSSAWFFFPTTLCGVLVFDSVSRASSSSVRPPPPTTHLSHTICHIHKLNTQLCHIPSFTYNNFTHQLNTQLCHIPSFTS